MTSNPSLAAIRDDLAFLDDWDDRYAYLIDLGRGMPRLPPDAYSDQNKVQGCASQVWLLMRPNPDGRTLHIEGDSDALIVKGLVALVIAIFGDRSFEEITGTDAQAIFGAIGLRSHLTAQRSNGLAAMVARIKAEATKFAA